MDFKDYLKKNAKAVDECLEDILSNFLKETKKTNPKLLPFAKSFVKSCKGGKRIRGVLVKLGYEMTQTVILSETKDLSQMRVSNKLRDSLLIAQNDILKVAAAYEILHTALLIHDDIIDKSRIRRGQPSLYAFLGNNHYGISQAISLGDIGLYLPIKIITETKFTDEVKIKALNYFSQILINTGWGQIMDVEKSKDTNFINLYKTAKYTIAGPLQIGAMIAGGKEQLVNNLGIFGDNLGIAFQLQDDILDSEVIDVKKTHVKALEYANRAKKSIREITTDKETRELLEEMIEYLVAREK